MTQKGLINTGDNDSNRDSTAYRNTDFNELTVARALGRVSKPVKQSGVVSSIKGMVLWERNSDGPVNYVSPNHHTLSLYLGGGNGTWSCEKKAWGFADAICLLPKGMDTRWEHNGYVKNLHVYFTDNDLSELNWQHAPKPTPIIYARNTLLHSVGRMLAYELDWLDAGDQLTIDHLTLALLSHLSVADMSTAGKLSSGLIKQLDERMRALDEGPPSVKTLAAIANLSPRHLSRLYKESTHTTLMQRQRWIQIEKSKAMLQEADSLLDIAKACGFSSQSHFSRAFRQGTGVTPLVWRRSHRN